MSAAAEASRLLLESELWVVAAAVLAGMLWSPLLIAAPLVGLGYVLARLVLKKRLPGPTPADLAILLLALLLPLNYAFAAVPEHALSPILRLSGGIALYYALVHWGRTPYRLRILGALTGLAALALSLLSLIAVTWTSGKLLFIPASLYRHFTLLITDTIHPNVLAGSLIALLPLALAVPLFAWHRSNLAERLGYVLVFAFTLAALLLAQSRGALVAFLAAILLVFVLRSRWFWLLPLAGLLAGGGSWILLGISELEFLFRNFISVAGFGQRADIWQRTLFMLQDFPLTGVGMGHYPDAFQLFYPMNLEATSGMPHAHNLFLQVAADLGIPGLVLWLGVLLAALAAAWQVFRAGKALDQPLTTGIAAGLLGCQAAILVHGMMDSVLWGEIRSAPLVWWVWGLSMAALNLVSREHRSDPLYYNS